MLYRKIRSYIDDHLRSNEDKILLIEGARQIGKSYIIRDVGTELYDNYVEINFVEDDAGDKIFKNVRTTEEFYLNLSMVAGSKLDRYENTLVFIDEIQHYSQFLTMLKFLRQEHRYRFICSGSLLGIALKKTKQSYCFSLGVQICYLIFNKTRIPDCKWFRRGCDYASETIL